MMAVQVLVLSSLGLISLFGAQPIDFVWENIDNANFELGDFRSYTFAMMQTPSLDACRQYCNVGCDFAIYNTQNGLCKQRLSDKTDNKEMIFKDADKPIGGELRGVATSGTITTNSVDACSAACKNANNCDFAVMETSNPQAIQCQLKKFAYSQNTLITYRTNPAALNYDPSRLGTIVFIGNTGVVCIHASLLPDGKISCTARPEYLRGSPNMDNIARASVPFGEIATVFDPVTGSSVPSLLNDNIFCHAQTLMENGEMFSAGGDGSPGIDRDAGQGLQNGLDNMRIFDWRTNTWRHIVKMQKTRWYPSVVRTSDEKFIIIGGQVDGNAYVMQASLEIFDPNGAQGTMLVNSPLIATSWATNFPKMSMIPGSGHFFIFANKLWSVINKNTGVEIDKNFDWQQMIGVRSGGLVGASVTLPMTSLADGSVGVAEMIIFGGGVSDADENAIASVVRIEITAGNKQWKYDENMPYGRLVSDAIIQANGKILLVNGWRHGFQGVGIGNCPGSANEVFCYDVEKPQGQRYSVLAHTNTRRHYHGSAMYVPDGRTIIMGTDQATYDPTTAYQHKAEALTPPWQLNGTPRPRISWAPEFIQYGATFKISFNGAPVSRVSLLAPGSLSHGTEFNQRMLILYVVDRTATTLTLRAPKDSTVMLSGYNMLFVCNGDTCSEAAWVRLTRNNVAPQEVYIYIHLS